MKAVVKIRQVLEDVYNEGTDYYNFSIVLLNVGEREKAKEYALLAKELYGQLNEPHLMQNVDELVAEIEGEG